jgi:hypothetical protein
MYYNSHTVLKAKNHKVPKAGLWKRTSKQENWFCNGPSISDDECKSWQNRILIRFLWGREQK